MIKKILINLIIYFIFLNSFYFLKANDEVNISAEKITFNEKDRIINAQGGVMIEGDNIRIYTEKVDYNEIDKNFIAKDSIRIVDENKNSYYAETLTTNLDFSNVNAKKIKIRLKDNSRIVGSNFKRINNLNLIKDGQYTPCDEKNYLIENCPGWKIKANSVYHDENSKTIHYDHSILYVLNIPVLYTPYFSHPDPSVNKRTGFLAPTIKADDKLGQSISLPYFFNIDSNKDLTITPTFQTTANNHLTSELRFLNKKGIYNIEANISDNEDKLGTKHYLFANAELESQLDKFEIEVQTSNNDTYMKRNQINKLDVLSSGITISDTYRGNYFLLEAKSYKHLAATENNQWEYLYPKLMYNVSNISLPKTNLNMGINNEIIRQRYLSRDLITSLSTLINIDGQNINKKYGLIFDNFADTRITYYSVDHQDQEENINQIRLFPQIGSIISYPLKKTDNNTSQILKPILMPILAPYNNYSKLVEINNSNIFSSNRASNLSEWESGPRVNYGIEWFLDYKDIFDSRFIIGQSLKFNKNKSDTSDELSDLMTSIFFNLNENIYSNADFVIDKKKYNVSKSNITSSFDLNDIKIKAEYDYVSDSFLDPSEQFGIAAEIKLKKDTSFVISGKKDLYLNKNIGYEAGIMYENDCLAINFKYYRDLTKFKDIEDTKGISFLITLKPFGNTKSFGKSRTFGPQI